MAFWVQNDRNHNYRQTTSRSGLETEGQLVRGAHASQRCVQKSRVTPSCASRVYLLSAARLPAATATISRRQNTITADQHKSAEPPDTKSGCDRRQNRVAPSNPTLQKGFIFKHSLYVRWHKYRLRTSRKTSIKRSTLL